MRPRQVRRRQDSPWPKGRWTAGCLWACTQFIFVDFQNSDLKNSVPTDEVFPKNNPSMFHGVVSSINETSHALTTWNLPFAARRYLCLRAIQYEIYRHSWFCRRLHRGVVALGVGDPGFPIGCFSVGICFRRRLCVESRVQRFPYTCSSSFLQIQRPWRSVNCAHRLNFEFK